MNVVLGILGAVGAIILCGGLVNWMNIYRQKQGVGAKQVEELLLRLAEIERRLGDIQEVVQALDEKLEHLEMRGAKAQEG